MEASTEVPVIASRHAEALRALADFFERHELEAGYTTLSFHESKVSVGFQPTSREHFGAIKKALGYQALTSVDDSFVRITGQLTDDLEFQAYVKWEAIN